MINVQFQKISKLFPQRGLKFPVDGASVRPKKKEMYELNWNFQKSCEGRVLEKVPSVGVWIICGSTQCNPVNNIFFIFGAY